MQHKKAIHGLRWFMGLGVIALCFTTAINEVDAQKYSTARASRFSNLGGGQGYFSQSSQSYRANNRAPMSRIRVASNPGRAAAPLTKTVNKALNFYGGQNARQILQQMPQKTVITTTHQTAQFGKPFQNTVSSPTISPYLNLYRTELDDTLPNYYAYVRPQLNQRRANVQQQRQISGLRRQVQIQQVQTVSPGGGMPGTGHTARYLDTGHYYQQ